MYSMQFLGGSFISRGVGVCTFQSDIWLSAIAGTLTLQISITKSEIVGHLLAIKSDTVLFGLIHSRFIAFRRDS